MVRGSNSIIGMVNFVTFVISIPVLGAGIWLGARADSSECLRFLQWPLILLGIAIMVVSLMGFAGACYRVAWLLRLYLFTMFLLVVALLFTTIFAFAAISGGGGHTVPGLRFAEYRLSDFSGWLKDKVSQKGYWRRIMQCVRSASVCGGMGRYVRDPATGLVMPEPANMFYRRELSPIESGCCKPPISCGYAYINETVWSPDTSTVTPTNLDCARWSNDQSILCYRCDSCKAGVLASIRHSWRTAAVINAVVVVVLVLVYAVGCAAFQDARRIKNNEPFGVNRMTKVSPIRWRVRLC